MLLGQITFIEGLPAIVELIVGKFVWTFGSNCKGKNVVWTRQNSNRSIVMSTSAREEFELSIFCDFVVGSPSEIKYKRTEEVREIKNVSNLCCQTLKEGYETRARVAKESMEKQGGNIERA